MIAQQHLRLIEQLTFVFGAGTLITPPQLLQDLVPCRPTYHFIHSRHGNSHFWRNVSFFPSLHPLPGNKTFGAIRLRRWKQFLLPKERYSDKLRPTCVVAAISFSALSSSYYCQLMHLPPPPPFVSPDKTRN